MKVQSLLFERGLFTPAGAADWARRHHFRAGKVDTKGRHHRARQFSPKRCRPSDYATIPFRPGVKAVLCRQSLAEADGLMGV